MAQPNPAQLQPINFHFPLPINLLARLCQHDICNHVLIIGSARKASAGERNGFPQSNAALDGQRYVRENSCHSCLSALCAAYDSATHDSAIPPHNFPMFPPFVFSVSRSPLCHKTTGPAHLSAPKFRQERHVQVGLLHAVTCRSYRSFEKSVPARRSTNMPLLPELPRRFVYRWSVVSCMHRLHRQAQQPARLPRRVLSSTY